LSAQLLFSSSLSSHARKNARTQDRRTHERRTHKRRTHKRTQQRRPILSSDLKKNQILDRTQQFCDQTGKKEIVFVES
jgi:hypothetical protein